jgi:hypothetical protein
MRRGRYSWGKCLGFARRTFEIGDSGCRKSSLGGKCRTMNGERTRERRRKREMHEIEGRNIVVIKEIGK